MQLRKRRRTRRRLSHPNPERPEFLVPKRNNPSVPHPFDPPRRISVERVRTQGFFAIAPGGSIEDSPRWSGAEPWDCFPTTPRPGGPHERRPSNLKETTFPCPILSIRRGGFLSKGWETTKPRSDARFIHRRSEVPVVDCLPLGSEALSRYAPALIGFAENNAVMAHNRSMAGSLKGEAHFCLAARFRARSEYAMG